MKKILTTLFILASMITILFAKDLKVEGAFECEYNEGQKTYICGENAVLRFPQVFNDCLAGKEFIYSDMIQVCKYVEVINKEQRNQVEIFMELNSGLHTFKENDNLCDARNLSRYKELRAQRDILYILDNYNK